MIDHQQPHDDSQPPEKAQPVLEPTRSVDDAQPLVEAPFPGTIKLLYGYGPERTSKRVAGPPYRGHRTPDGNPPSRKQPVAGPPPVNEKWPPTLPAPKRKKQPLPGQLFLGNGKLQDAPATRETTTGISRISGLIPSTKLIFTTPEMARFADWMWQGILWYLEERNRLFTDEQVLHVCWKRLNLNSAFDQNIAFIAGWFQALYYCESGPQPSDHVEYMQLGNGHILLPRGRSLEQGYLAGHEAFCTYKRNPRAEQQKRENMQWVILAVRHSDKDKRPLADKLYDVGMLIGWFLTGTRLSPHFSQVRVKENGVGQRATH